MKQKNRKKSCLKIEQKKCIIVIEVTKEGER